MKKPHQSINAFSQDFWKFTCSLHSDSETEAACLCLEEKYQLNINILLFCCWLAAQHFQRISEVHVRYMTERIKQWRHKIIIPLKSLYLWLKYFARNRKVKTLPDLCNDHILFAEKIEQSLLLQIVPQLERQEHYGTSEINVALSNMFAYINSQKISLHQIDLEKVYYIANHCF